MTLARPRRPPVDCKDPQAHNKTQSATGWPTLDLAGLKCGGCRRDGPFCGTGCFRCPDVGKSDLGVPKTPSCLVSVEIEDDAFSRQGSPRPVGNWLVCDPVPLRAARATKPGGADRTRGARISADGHIHCRIRSGTPLLHLVQFPAVGGLYVSTGSGLARDSDRAWLAHNVPPDASVTGTILVCEPRCARAARLGDKGDLPLCAASDVRRFLALGDCPGAAFAKLGGGIRRN